MVFVSHHALFNQLPWSEYLSGGLKKRKNYPIKYFIMTLYLES
jgi:hypothetical protein